MKPDQITRLAKVLIAVLIVLSAFSVLIVWQWPDRYLHIVICDVGQGDAIVLTQGFTQVVVDAGLKDEDILQCLRQHLPFWDRQIEWIIPTHLDADHIGGFAAVLDRFKVDYLLSFH
jgi:beta-lactamase superfamily II metal-dependent hydrolase